MLSPGLISRAKRGEKLLMRRRFERAVVLGATGATGQQVVRALADRGIPTRVVSRSAEHLRTSFGELAVEQQVADVTDAAQARGVMEGCDQVFVCIGFRGAQFHLHRLVGKNVAAAMKDLGSRVLLVSSYWGYGPIQSPIGENDPRQPATLLGEIRRELEDAITEAGGCVAVLPDFWGPGVAKRISFLNEGLDALVRGRTVVWIGDPDVSRDFIYVPDVGSLLVELAGHEAVYGRRIPVPGSGPVTPRAVLERVAQQHGQRLRLRRVGGLMATVAGIFNADLRAFKSVLPLYQQPAWMSGATLEELFGHLPAMTSYDEGLEPTLAFLARRQ
jgi:nucleoside-diphosphate-sugar epimerase